MNYLFIAAVLFPFCMQAQEKAVSYPTPEFSNEIYYFKRDSGKAVRLEKGSSQLDTKAKMGGFGGAESGYKVTGKKSTVRLNGEGSLSFIYYTGEPAASNPHADSVMRASGLDPSMNMNTMVSYQDPSRTVSLYGLLDDKDGRKLIIQSGAGMKLLGKGNKNSEKFTISVRKIREGYYELLVDKTLPRGEYAFTMMDLMSMDGSTTLFCFGID